MSRITEACIPRKLRKNSVLSYVLVRLLLNLPTLASADNGDDIVSWGVASEAKALVGLEFTHIQPFPPGCFLVLPTGTGQDGSVTTTVALMTAFKAYLPADTPWHAPDTLPAQACGSDESNHMAPTAASIINHHSFSSEFKTQFWSSMRDTEYQSVLWMFQ